MRNLQYHGKQRGRGPTREHGEKAALGTQQRLHQMCCIIISGLATMLAASRRDDAPHATHLLGQLHRRVAGQAEPVLHHLSLRKGRARGGGRAEVSVPGGLLRSAARVL